jgi:hypothetical protein
MPSIQTGLNSNPVFVRGQEIGMSGEMMSKPPASTLVDQAHRLIAA